MEWAYGITTVPERRRELFPRTLRSLQQAGFERPRLFVDGDKDPSSWEEEFRLPATAHHPPLRTAGKWVLSLYELYLRQPAAERYALFQDDLVTCHNLRAYLEQCLYPERGYWNLYTFPSNQSVPHSGKGWYRSRTLLSGPPGFQTGRGAVGLVFDRATVITLLSARHLVERAQDPHRGWRAIDGGIVTALNQAGWHEYVHDPSLLQHMGTISSMGNSPHLSATSFPGEDFDALSLLAS